MKERLLMASDETRKMVLAAAAACDDKKAEDTRILELDPADSGFTDFFLIASAANERQAVAIADEIELRLKREFATYPNSVEGRRQGEWVLMDYVDFVVHIFLKDKRAFYDIERLRKSAKTVDLEELKAALTKKTVAARKKVSKPAAAAKKAPAKKAPAKKAPAKKAAKKVTPAKKVAAKKAAPKKAARKTSAAKKTAK
ncbi:ribosome silencing factor [Acidipila rosea]|uniref:Ribosomal silencing factor RsfS n=1 Tax=Acidipila rosea TaxID=768535 RepID=A0A4R1L132_9BACT|nr:ribosome silencing factor [Acidipila rosea]TCK71534.1 ribosome-associated protein [Acidipila rosea]